MSEIYNYFANVVRFLESAGHATRGSSYIKIYRLVDSRRRKS